MNYFPILLISSPEFFIFYLPIPYRFFLLNLPKKRNSSHLVKYKDDEARNMIYDILY